MVSAAKAIVGDLVLSRTYCYGIVLLYLPESDHYIVLWTIEKNGIRIFNEQLRDSESFSKIR